MLAEHIRERGPWDAYAEAGWGVLEHMLLDFCEGNFSGYRFRVARFDKLLNLDNQSPVMSARVLHERDPASARARARARTRTRTEPEPIHRTCMCALCARARRARTRVEQNDSKRRKYGKRLRRRSMAPSYCARPRLTTVTTTTTTTG